MLTLKDDDIKEDAYLFMGTKNGIVKKTPLTDFRNIRKSGLIAISLREGDELLRVKLTHGDADIIVVTRNGYSIRFNEQDVRPMGRTASGVKAITLREGDIAVCMDIAVSDEKLLVISEFGYGKRTSLTEYKVQGRGGMGLITYKLSDKTGVVVGATVCKDDDEIMLINNSGVAIRVNVADISTTSKYTMGVKVMRTLDEEEVVAIAKIPASEKLEDDNDENIENEEVSNEVISDNGLEQLVESAEESEE